MTGGFHFKLFFYIHVSINLHTVLVWFSTAMYAYINPYSTQNDDNS